MVRFVGVAWYGDADSFQGFVDEHGLTFPQIDDDAASVFDRFDVPVQPAFAFVATDGSFERVSGAVGTSELDARIRHLLA